MITYDSDTETFNTQGNQATVKPPAEGSNIYYIKEGYVKMMAQPEPLNAQVYDIESLVNLYESHFNLYGNQFVSTVLYLGHYSADLIMEREDNGGTVTEVIRHGLEQNSLYMFLVSMAGSSVHDKEDFDAQVIPFVEKMSESKTDKNGQFKFKSRVLKDCDYEHDFTFWAWQDGEGEDAEFKTFMNPDELKEALEAALKIKHDEIKKAFSKQSEVLVIKGKRINY